MLNFQPTFASIRMAEQPDGLHANFVNRQFWTVVKLFRNVMLWQGFLSDGIVSDLAISSLLNRFLLIGLGCNPNPIDALAKGKTLVKLIDGAWGNEVKKFNPELARFAKYLEMLGKSSPVGRDGILDIVAMLQSLGFSEEASTVKRLRLK